MKKSDKIKIQAYLDNELTGEEKFYVEELLIKDAEAGSFYNELKLLDDLLTSVPPETASIELKDSILNSIDTMQHKRSQEAKSSWGLQGLLPNPGARFAVALAAGILIGILISTVIFDALPGKRIPEDKVQGTFSRYLENSTSIANIHYTGFSGDLYLESIDDEVSKFHVDIHDASKTVLTFQYNPDEVYMKGFVVHDKRSYPRVITMSNKVRIEFTGPNKFTMVFVKQIDKSSDLIFTLSNDLGVQHERKLSL